MLICTCTDCETGIVNMNVNIMAHN